MKDKLSPEITAAHEEVVRVQVERFHEFYSEFFNQKETIKMAEFFFETLYNLEGKEELETLAINTYSKVKNLIKEATRESIERLLDLNRITDELDIKLGSLMVSKGWKVGDKITQTEYINLYRELGHSALRKKQLEVVLFNLRKFYELAHRHINSYIMKPASVMSKMLGVYLLFKKIEQGHAATLPVSKEVFENFFAEVEKREWEFLYSAFPDLKENI